MDTIVERCCGLDVHQAVIVASVLIGEPGKRVQKQTRSFRALTAGLSELQQWLREQGVTHVAMEAASTYVQSVLQRDETQRGEYSRPFGPAIDVQLAAKGPALDPRGASVEAGLVAFSELGPSRPKPPLNRCAIGTIGDDHVWITPLAEPRAVRIAATAEAQDRLARWLVERGAVVLGAEVHAKTLKPAW